MRTVMSKSLGWKPFLLLFSLFIQGCIENLPLGRAKIAAPDCIVPIINRDQKIDFTQLDSLVSRVSDEDCRYVKTFRRFSAPAQCISSLRRNGAVEKDCSKDREILETRLGELQESHPQLYALCHQILDPASEIFGRRAIDSAIWTRFFSFFTPEGKNNLKIILLQERGNAMNARYLPEGVIALLGIDDNRIGVDEAYRAQVGFLIAHELGHAVALHSLEDRTAVQKSSSRLSKLGGNLLDRQIDRFYGSLDPETAGRVDQKCSLLAEAFLPTETTEADKTTEDDDQSLISTLVSKFGMGDEVGKAQSGKAAPPQTHIIIKTLLLKGLELTDVLPLLQRKSEDMVFLVNAAAHSKDQEFEADHIGFYLAGKAGLPSAPILDFLAGKSAGEAEQSSREVELGGHPSFGERISRLKGDFQL